MLWKKPPTDIFVTRWMSVDLVQKLYIFWDRSLRIFAAEKASLVYIARIENVNKL